MTDTEQMRNELNAVIERYAQESDVTICEALGVLELVKIGLVERLLEEEKE